MATQSVHVVAKVLSVHRNISFPCCVTCSRRLRTLKDENLFFCSYCGQDYDKKSLIFRYRVNLTVSDRSHISNVTIFGQCLEMFFGTSATHFNRFLKSSLEESRDLPIPIEQLVQQCVDQCFVGTMVRLTFRGLIINDLCIDSPLNLKTIEEITAQSKKTSNLLASHISRLEDLDNGVTVFEILKDNLKSLTQRISSPNISKHCLFSNPEVVLSQGTDGPLSCESSRQSFYSNNSCYSQLVLSCDTPSSTARSPLSNKMTTKDVGTSSMCYSPIYDISQNTTVLLLLRLQGLDSSSLSSNNCTNNTSPGYFPSELLDVQSNKEGCNSSCLLDNYDKTSQDLTGRWEQTTKSFMKMDTSNIDCVDLCGDLSTDLANMSISYQSCFDKESTVEHTRWNINEIGLNQVDTVDCQSKSMNIANSILDDLIEPKTTGLCLTNQEPQGHESINKSLDDSFDQYLMLCKDDISDSLLQEACEAVMDIDTVGPSKDASNTRNVSIRGEPIMTRVFEEQHDSSRSLFLDHHQRSETPNLFDDSCNINPAVYRNFTNHSTPLHLEYKSFLHSKVKSPLIRTKLVKNEQNQRDDNQSANQDLIDSYKTQGCLEESCSQSLLLFSFLSEYDSLTEEMQGAIQKADIPNTPITNVQDSLLTSSLLECSYLK